MTTKNLKLKKYLKDKGVGYKDLAIVLNTTYTNVYYKINGIREFNVYDIKIIKNYLKLTDRQTIDFFVNK